MLNENPAGKKVFINFTDIRLNNEYLILFADLSFMFS